MSRSERGFAAVETALLLPVFILLFMGVIDFGRLFWTQNTVTAAAEEGARMAVLTDTSDDEVMQTVKDYLKNGGIEEPPTIEIGARVPDQPVSVKVSVGFSFMTLLHSLTSLVDIDRVTSTAVMVHER
ncbi:TadE/TadG family type IV pilus assembly protein [Desulfovibrio sp. X2]|uniref:TadE/TadG family type IV pilus assembly protein n=1 Tax=Desulfovibrio sp. X2 TaxID=941449 RepID=UPI001F20779D|nr:TadE family protein [Desulfovibrio sp. X2]